VNIQEMLGEVAPAVFFGEYFHRLPFTLPQAARGACELGTWSVLGALLGHEDADVMVVRDGLRYEGPAPRSLDAAQALSAQGYTVLVRHAERHDRRLAELAASFERDFAGAVDVHVYVTPPGMHGFGWHYDAEDVFILQTAGRKEYSLRKNTVHPWPLVETMGADLHYERELMPLSRVLLAAGDWLYIPCGYWHRADASVSEETSISLAVGVMSPAAIDVYDFLRGKLVESLMWRQRLPTPAAAGRSLDEVEVEYLSLFSQLADDLAATLRNQATVRDFLSGRQCGTPASVARPECGTC
jgi:ribosomal protein L16 Arg81 hydroxylase